MNFVSMRASRGLLLPKPVFWFGFFFRFLHQTGSSIKWFWLRQFKQHVRVAPKLMLP